MLLSGQKNWQPVNDDHYNIKAIQSQLHCYRSKLLYVDAINQHTLTVFNAEVNSIGSEQFFNSNANIDIRGTASMLVFR